jgi:hypothetical protein
MSQFDFILITKWKARFVCPVHGPTSWPTCIQCHAEAALAQKLKLQRERLRVSVDPITVDQILEQAGIDPVRPQDETLTSDEGQA